MTLLDRVQGRPFVLIDGPAGSGKTTLAATFGAPVVHLDELYEGWTGMAAGLEQAQRLVDCLGRGEPAGYRRYDWVAGAPAEWVTVEAAPLIVVEGCGAGSLAADALRIWIETDQEERLRRGLARDGESYREHWLAWQQEEEAHFAAHRTRELCDVRLTT